MRFSLITSTPNEMYAFNPFINTPAVAPLTMEAFVAPADFNPDAQELNIVKAFAAYPNANKKYIFSVGNDIATSLFEPFQFRKYAYSENGNPFTLYTGTLPYNLNWTPGSNKRSVIIVDSQPTIATKIREDAVWVYVSDKVNSLTTIRNNLRLKYIHCQNLSTIGNFDPFNFAECVTLTGILTLPPFITNLSESLFIRVFGIVGEVVIPNAVTQIIKHALHGTSISKLSIPESIINIGDYAIAECNLLTRIDCKKITPATVTSLTFAYFNQSACTLHVPIGSLAAYQAAPYWNKFTNIIADL